MIVDYKTFVQITKTPNFSFLRFVFVIPCRATSLRSSLYSCSEHDFLAFEPLAVFTAAIHIE